MRLIYFACVTIICALVFSLARKPALALPTFSTDYNIIYDVNEQGSTHVTFNIGQKNNLSTVYATSFGLSLSQTNLENIQIRDAIGLINPTINTTDNLTNINFDFLNKVVGKDKVNQFSIQYDSSDIANKHGQIWEINIPRLEPNENTASQQILLRVPSKFGPPAYIDPKPVRSDGNNYYFNSAVLANKSISAVFGTTQFFRLNLKYNLHNPLDTDLETQIALPPQTPYQEIYLEKLDPPANDIQVDPDGNWLASYSIKPNSDINLTASIYAKLSFNPRRVNLTNPTTYTRETKYWNYSDPEIISKSSNLKSSKSIYDFVTDYLQYDYNRLNTNAAISNRQGATWAINNPLQAICTEFTDLFVAIARKNNIPSRELEGYALSSNDKLKPISLSKDVLHAWPEYYDQEKQTWIQIDPTWGNTTGGVDYFNKLDLNHIVFAIHGTDPIQPLPAGAYKTAVSTTKDVFVEISQPIEFPQPKFSLSYARQDQKRLYLTLANTSGVVGNASIKIISPTNYQATQSSFSLPPFSNTSLEINRPQTPLLRSSHQTLIINLNGQNISVDFTNQPYIQNYFIWGAAILFAAGLAGLTRSLYLRRRKQKSSLHW